MITTVCVTPNVDMGLPIRSRPRKKSINEANIIGVKRYPTVKETLRNRLGVISPRRLVPILRRIFPTAPSNEDTMMTVQTTIVSNSRTSPITSSNAGIKDC